MVDALYGDKNNINLQLNDQYTHITWIDIQNPRNTIRLTQFNTINARGNVTIDFQIHLT